MFQAFKLTFANMSACPIVWALSIPTAIMLFKGAQPLFHVSLNAFANSEATLQTTEDRGKQVLWNHSTRKPRTTKRATIVEGAFYAVEAKSSQLQNYYELHFLQKTWRRRAVLRGSRLVAQAVQIWQFDLISETCEKLHSRICRLQNSAHKSSTSTWQWQC